MKEIKLTDYRSDVDRLLTYIPWLEQKAGAKVSSMYEKSTLSFPVYDTMLMNFINDASKTGLMDKNYVYAYSRGFIRTVQDEKNAIEAATIQDGEVLCGILSKYVLGGHVKGYLWTQAVEEGIFLAILKKFKVLLDVWDGPLA